MLDYRSLSSVSTATSKSYNNDENSTLTKFKLSSAGPVPEPKKVKRGTKAGLASLSTMCYL